MSKKITAIIMTLVMVFSVIGASAAEVQAASTPFMSVVWDGPVKEKAGSYYIWVKAIEDDYGQTDYELRSSKTSGAKGTLLDTVTGNAVITSIISNGQTVYYGVLDRDKKQMVIYKTPVASKNRTKFRTVSDVTAQCGPITVFNNRLYYDRDTTDINGKATWNIYSVNLSNKDCRLEKAGFAGQSGYGRYMTCDNENKVVKTQLYNAKTGKSTSLITSKESRVYNGSIYYADWNQMGASVKKTDLTGKNSETLGEISAEEEWVVTYLGKTTAYFVEWQQNKYRKLTYATKKLVKIDPIEQITVDTGETGSPAGSTGSTDNSKYEYVMTVDPIPDQEFKGKEVRPVPKVRINGKLLKKSQYNVNYYNNFEPGYGIAEIELGTPAIIIADNHDEYMEELKKFNKTSDKVKFKILHPRYKTTEGPICGFGKVKDYYYTGKPIIPDYKVWGTNVYLNKKVLLKEGVDYTARIKNNIKPGRAVITATGITYSGTHNKNFKILKAPISRVTVKGIEDKVYTGKALKQGKLSLVYNGKKLVKGKDYTVTYKNNVKCGKASVVITGKGECFTGTVTKNFNIVKNGPGKAVLSGVKCVDHNSIKVTWKKASNAKKYQVWRAASKDGKYKLIKTTTETSFTNTKLITGKKYYYKVRAISGTLEGKFSSVKSAVPKLKQVTGVKVEPKETSVKLTWNKVNGATGYQIYRATVKTGTYKKVTAVSGTSFTNKKLTANKKYYYKVRAYKKVSGSLKYGDFSIIKYAKTKNHSYTESVTAPSCTEKGYTLYTCSVCGKSYKDKFTSATGHDLVEMYREKDDAEVKTDNEADLVLEGYECSAEGCSYTEPHAHDCTEEFTDVETGAVYLMCGTEGCCYAEAANE